MSILVGLILLAIALVLMAIAGIWGLILAFGEHPFWGLAYLLVPFAAFVFMIAKWSRRAVRKNFFLSFTGLGFWVSGFLVLFLSSPSNWAFITDLRETMLPWGETAAPSDSNPVDAPAVDAPFSTISERDDNRLGRSLASLREDAEPQPADTLSSTVSGLDAADPESSSLDALEDLDDDSKPSMEDEYHSIMMTGYEAFQAKDYEIALAHFRQAMTLRPDDPYVTDAIANTQSILAKQSANHESSQPISEALR